MYYFFDLENENGFYCLFFFLLHSYIYACKNNFILYIKDDKWKFTNKNGLDDYIIFNNNIAKYYNNNDNKKKFGYACIPDINYSLNEYKLYSKQLYNINQNILKNYNLPEKYNSIFLRGGDKLLYEAKQLPISQYISFLLKLNIQTNNLFVHSDDNILVELVEKYIIINNINLKVFKITNQNSNGGACVMKRLRYGNCTNIKSVDEMNSDEVKEHTELFLNAIEIMRKSDNVILSYDSNVSRFMKINFDCNVYSINHSNNLNFDVPTKNPAYGF
jgi:hypothetical protein